MMMMMMMTAIAMFTALRYHHSSPVLSWTGVHYGVHTHKTLDDDHHHDDYGS